MTDHNNQQYKWRQRKKRNARITVWLILVVVLAACGTFAYEGIKGSDPQNTAEKYFRAAAGITDYTVETGERSLNSDNQFVQDYTFTYTADGKEESRKVSLTQLNEKKYGLFEQWEPQAAAADAVDMDLIVPAGSQVLINKARPDASAVKADETLSPGAVCYRLTQVDPKSVLQINGLPFESYEGTLETSGGVLDARNMLSVSENAKIQMEELGKSMISELYAAAIEQKEASDLSDAFAEVANKENVYKVISQSLYKDDTALTDSITFEGFEPTFGDVYYPGTGEESFIGMEMKLKYTCKYEILQPESEEEEPQSEEEGETETEASTEAQAPVSVDKEATFYFRYRDGKCIVTSAEVPGIL